MFSCASRVWLDQAAGFRLSRLMDVWATGRVGGQPRAASFAAARSSEESLSGQIAVRIGGSCHYFGLVAP
jgi:hypothetical protein